MLKFLLLVIICPVPLLPLSLLLYGSISPVVEMNLLNPLPGRLQGEPDELQICRRRFQVYLG